MPVNVTRGRRLAPGRRLLRIIMKQRPRTDGELYALVTRLLGLRMPRQPLIAGNDAPFDYLLHTFFEGVRSPSADCVVWANRGGGKTYLGAVATLLDMIFKPGIQVRILGGSFAQSSKMYDYLRQMLEQPALRELVDGTPTQRRIALVNASRVELLSQSQRSVRGQRVHKLRCDEVEEFKDDIWQAAQLVTRGGSCGDVEVKGSIEAMSTAHRPYGIMTRLIDQAQQRGAPRLFRWCAMDVIERCEPQRKCETCVLWPDCRGKAKHADGFVRVDDLIAQWNRSSNEAWASELMCRRPKRSDCVYANFSLEKHVRCMTVDGGQIIGGMDFGLRSPLVMLWAQVRGKEDGRIVEVFDEYVQENLTLERHLDAIAMRLWPRPQWIGVDPAGKQRNAHTGVTDVHMLRTRGYTVRTRSSYITDGVECIRRRLDRTTLTIDPRCTQLIQALSTYHFDAQNPGNDNPVKDGPDHLCDALRYMIVNLESGGRGVTRRMY